MPAYIGLNCNSACPYPTYGDRCQELCDCSNEKCDVSTGCRDLSTLTMGMYFNLSYFDPLTNMCNTYQIKAID